MAPAWEIVEKWESLCPVKHRTPVPENVVCAMCVLAWHMQWWSWVGATILSFYGAGRLGEVLRCPREDLVLPRDVFETTVQETNWDAQREKACVNTYAHASASQICLQNICGQQQNFPMAGPTFGSKSGPQNGAQAKT